MTIPTIRRPAHRRSHRHPDPAGGRRRRPGRPRRRRPGPRARHPDRRPRGRCAAGSAVLEWGHVRLFSPWSELIDPVAEKLLTESRLDQPRPGVVPHRPRLGRALPRAPGRAARRAARRRGPLRPPRRRRRPRRPRPAGRRRPRRGAVHGARRDPRGPQRAHRAAVIDASGTWGTPTRSAATATRPTARPSTPTGSSTASRTYRPEVAARYAGKHVAVAGRGASAQNALVALTSLAGTHPGPG